MAAYGKNLVCRTPFFPKKKVEIYVRFDNNRVEKNLRKLLFIEHF